MTRKPSHTEMEKRIEELEQQILDQNKVRSALEETEEQFRIISETQNAKLENLQIPVQDTESIRIIAGGVAHDLNNILGIILGNTELALHTVPEGNPAYPKLEEIRKACFRAKDTVNLIFSFSRQIKEKKTRMRVTPLLEAIIKQLRSAFPEALEIKEDFLVCQDTILGDPAQISQIIVNLCNNTVHARGQKGGILKVSLRNIEFDQSTAPLHLYLSPGKYLVVSVSNASQGQEPNPLDQIADFNCSNEITGEGKRIDFANLQEILRNHGGVIQVDGNPAERAGFRIFLPLVECLGQSMPVPPAPLPKGTERILFVDDEKAIADLGNHMLKHLGYHVTVRTCALKALEAFKAQPDQYDLVITDLSMPKMTGLSLSKEILQVRPDMPIILFTGGSLNLTKEKIQQEGLKALLMKPLAMKDLAETIRDVLDQIKQEEQTKTRVLIVEDDDQVRGALRRLLEGAGHEVVEAPDGTFAGEIYREQPTDVVITDLIMPEKEGLELIMELRRDFPEVKIIAISGGGKLSARAYLPLAKEMGALRTLEKPFSQQDILQAVQEVLQQGESHQAGLEAGKNFLGPT